MGKYEVFYITGCSHIMGSELEGKQIHISDFNTKNRWPDVFHRNNLSNTTYYNESMGGNDNFNILATTIESLTDIINSGVNPQKILVVVGWTGIDRFSFASDWKTKKIDIDNELLKVPKMLRISTTLDERHVSKDHKLFIPKYKELFKGLSAHASMIDLHRKFFTYHHCMINFLELHKIPHLTYHSIKISKKQKLNDRIGLPYHNTGQNNHTKIKKLSNSNLFKFYENHANTVKSWEVNFVEYLLNKGYDPLEDGRHFHFTADAHKVWAEYFSTLLVDRNLL